MTTSHRTASRSAVPALIGVFLLSIVSVLPVAANSTVQPLPFSQTWTNTGQITLSDNWSGVPGIVGYRGDGLASPGIDPQQVTIASDVVDINANETDPDTYIVGGVTEFDSLADPVVALLGSVTADAPSIVLNLNTTGLIDIHVAYDLRDIDGSSRDAFQAVALQYRVGATGLFTNLPAGYVEDATTGPSLATFVTPVSVTLPSAANHKAVVQVRMITADAIGADEWVGIDDIVVTGTGDEAPMVRSTTPMNGATGVAVGSDISVTFSEPVNASAASFTIACLTSGDHPAAVSGGPTTFTLDPSVDFASSETCTATVVAAGVTDQDAIDPPDEMAVDRLFSFATEAASSPPTWDFTGFESILDSPRVNDAKAGAVVPVKFSLSGDQGLAIFQLGHPTSQSYTCGATPPSVATEPAANPGSTGLTYHRSQDEYAFLWKTDKAWEGTCRVFVLGLADGSTHNVEFHFK